MKSFLIFDGREHGDQLNQRERKLKSWISKVIPDAESQVIQSGKLLTKLQGSEASIAFVHHSELPFELGEGDVLPNHHFYIHYSGAGFQEALSPWSHEPNHMFWGESIDRSDEMMEVPLLALLKVLAGVSPAPPPEAWAFILKTIALVPFLNKAQNFLSNVPQWLSEGYLFEKGQVSSRQHFEQWCQEKKLSDGSSVSPLAKEYAWRILEESDLSSAPNEQATRDASDISVGEQPADATTTQASAMASQEFRMLAHHLKHLLFKVKAGEWPALKSDWNLQWRSPLERVFSEREHAVGLQSLADMDVQIEAEDASGVLSTLKTMKTALKTLEGEVPKGTPPQQGSEDALSTLKNMLGLGDVAVQREAERREQGAFEGAPAMQGSRAAQDFERSHDSAQSFERSRDSAQGFECSHDSAQGFERSHDSAQGFELLSWSSRSIDLSQHYPAVWFVGPHAQMSQSLKSLMNEHRREGWLQRPQLFLHDPLRDLERLLQMMREIPSQSLFHALVVVDIGQHLKEAINAGHRQRDLSASAHWTHDSRLQLGILVRLVVTFPQVSFLFTHSLEDEALMELLNTEWLDFVPQDIFEDAAWDAKNLQGSADERSSADERKASFLRHLLRCHFLQVKNGRLVEPQTLMERCRRFCDGQRMLFDPTGLRTLLKCRLIANIFSGMTDRDHPDLKQTEEQRKVLASRLSHVMVSVDEDVSSTLFHAYAGYRFGYRAWTVTNFQQFDSGDVWTSTGTKKLVIRDTDLRFPDIDGRERLREASGKSTPAMGGVRQRLESIYSDLWAYRKSEDSEAFHQKIDASWKVRCIAAGDPVIRKKPWVGSSDQESQWGEIKKSQAPMHVLGLRKPLSSLYDLSMLMEDESGGSPQTVASRLVPPERLKDGASHYAPYINLPLAAELLAQAKNLQGEDELDWLLGAVLAMEADEILLGMSEYTGLDAVRWLHRCEVRAEIRSVGFAGMIHIGPRKKELQHLVKMRYRNDELSQDHFLARLWDDLRTLYKSADQFHAAEEANIESFCKRKWLSSVHALGPVEEFVRRYFILSASSIWMWGASLMISTLILYGMYVRWLPEASEHLLFQVLASSLIGEPALGLESALPASMNAPLKVTLLLHYGTSYVLFGFFLSMIYRRLTRS